MNYRISASRQSSAVHSLLWVRTLLKLATISFNSFAIRASQTSLAAAAASASETVTYCIHNNPRSTERPGAALELRLWGLGRCGRGDCFALIPVARLGTVLAAHIFDSQTRIPAGGPDPDGVLFALGEMAACGRASAFSVDARNR